MAKISNSTTELLAKQAQLEAYLRELGSVAVAFSAGVDSSYLLAVAHQVLGSCAVAITAHSLSFPSSEQDKARLFCKERGIKQILIEHDQLAIPGFANNPKDRCYLCKRDLFNRILTAAADCGIQQVVDGTNLDDMDDYRPGMRALEELGIKSPLRDCGFTKADIRACSKEQNLPTWNKASAPCLATRFPYNTTISPEALKQVELAEHFLAGQGFQECRVRHHGSVARIELPPESFNHIMQADVREAVVARFQELGFSSVALDLAGYRMGSMNGQAGS